MKVNNIISHKVASNMRAAMIAGVLMVGLETLSQAAVVTGQSVDFSDADFIGGSTAQKTLVLDTDTSSTKNIWAMAGMSEGSNGLGVKYSQSTTAYVTWKVTAPSSLSISSFTWAWKTVYLTGQIGGDDQYAWQWSTDDATWSNLFLRANRASTDTAMVTLSNQTYTQTVAIPTSVLYVRAALIEGTTIANESGYFALNAGTATNTTSYINITTAPVPELSSLSLLGLGCSCMFMRRVRASQA